MAKIKAFFKFLKSLDYRHWIMIALIVASVALIPFFFQYAHLRIGESLVALWNSLKYYVSELLGLDLHGDITVNEFTELPFELPLHLPRTWEEFADNLSGYWSTFFSMENFSAYMAKVADVLFYITKGLLIIMPLFLVFVIVGIFVKPKQNNDYGKESKALRRFKHFEKRVYIPVKNWVVGFVEFVRENFYYVKALGWTWAYSFNIIAVVISFFAYYFYFISALKMSTLYIQLLKLLMDVSVIPVAVWVVVGLIALLKIRKSIGYNRLNHMEMMDRGFINERPIVFMLCGTMGKKKTTLITDMALSQEIMFRDKAFEKILDCDLKFPFFPWINLELELKHAMSVHYVYNLATCRRFIKSLKRRFYKSKDKYIFGYDFERYGMEYNDGLSVQNVWQVIEDYSQLYFIYVIESSLIISNYSIRTDNVLNDLGNFPLWDSDLFKRDSRYIDSYSRHSHILDFDSLRLGKKLVKNNKFADSFEFGVVNLTEIGKERKNKNELDEIKKKDLTANQKNDLFNSWLKMVRHSATVDNFSFVRVIMDEQRPESLCADARELCEIVNIDECSESRLALPFFFVENLIINLLSSGFEKRYSKYRFERGDYTLPMYLYHGFIAKLKLYQKNIYNLFGYSKVSLNVENGTLDGKFIKKYYYLLYKKIYPKRFSSDCYSGFFYVKALRSSIGINDLLEFQSEKATFDEMARENSYFFNDLNNLRNRER
ncbi:MAG: hypothetical protein ACI4MN_02110 [Candidatus Coproplasma sp.]